MAETEIGSRARGAEWPLVGRADELATIVATLMHGEVGGVILVGPAGVGKTRLAQRSRGRGAGQRAVPRPSRCGSPRHARPAVGPVRRVRARDRPERLDRAHGRGARDLPGARGAGRARRASSSWSMTPDGSTTSPQLSCAISARRVWRSSSQLGARASPNRNPWSRRGRTATSCASTWLRCPGRDRSAPRTRARGRGRPGDEPLVSRPPPTVRRCCCASW